MHVIASHSTQKTSSPTASRFVTRERGVPFFFCAFDHIDLGDIESIALWNGTPGTRWHKPRAGIQDQVERYRARRDLKI